APAVRRRPKLDSPGSAVLTVAVVFAFEGSVQQRAFVVSAHLTISDRYVLRGARKAESVRTFQADPVIEWRIDRAIGDADVATRIDVDAVAIGIDLKVVDRQVVDTGCTDCGVD